jgi:hypothetical protein
MRGRALPRLHDRGGEDAASQLVRHGDDRTVDFELRRLLSRFAESFCAGLEVAMEAIEATSNGGVA